MRCSGSRGPSLRMKPAQKSAVRRRSVSRIARRMASVSAAGAGAEHRRQPPQEGAAKGMLLHAHGVGGDLQKLMMILPNTCRLSSRASPRSTSPSGNSLSITGSMPPAILARLSRMLRIEAPNEPMMRYCC